jgi:hypothetical protein
MVAAPRLVFVVRCRHERHANAPLSSRRPTTSGGHNATYWIQSIGHIVSVQYEAMQWALGQRPSGLRR